MAPGFSIYLDLVRICAACVVVLTHAWPLLFPDHPMPWPGHEAVVVFFVLSGLVVSHATLRPGRTWADYARHRAARIGSVALPALALSVLAGLLVAPVGPMLAFQAEGDAAAMVRGLATSLSFTAQSWSNDRFPAFNPAYWSLNYEIWYYVLFGIWVFARARLRIALAVVAALCAGPKIWLLMPIWLLGVAADRVRWRWSGRMAAAMFVASLGLALLLFWFQAGMQVRGLMHERWPVFTAMLGTANLFVGDILMGGAVFLHFVAASRMDGALGFLLAGQRAIRGAASFTFSTYLYHSPLLALLWGGAGVRAWWAVMGLLLAAIVGLGLVTERRLGAARRLLERLGANGQASGMPMRAITRSESRVPPR